MMPRTPRLSSSNRSSNPRCVQAGGVITRTGAPTGCVRGAVTPSLAMTRDSMLTHPAQRSGPITSNFPWSALTDNDGEASSPNDEACVKTAGPEPSGSAKIRRVPDGSSTSSQAASRVTFAVDCSSTIAAKLAATSSWLPPSMPSRATGRGRPPQPRAGPGRLRPRWRQAAGSRPSRTPQGPLRLGVDVAHTCSPPERVLGFHVVTPSRPDDSDAPDPRGHAPA